MRMQQLVLEFTSRFDGRGVAELIDRMRNVRYETEGVMHTMNRLGVVFSAVAGSAASSFQRYEFSLTEFAGKAMKTTEEFGLLFNKVSGEIARSSGLARAEVLRGLQEGTSAQLNAELSADLTKKAAILGAGRQSLMRQTVNVALSGYRNAFGDPGKVLDYTYAAAQLGQGQVPEFAPAMQYVFPFARGAGIGLSEVAAGLSAISTTAPSPLMGSTQFGAFLTGIARGSTFEKMLIEKTGGRTSQGIRDMLRKDGLSRTAEFLASKFSGDELQQVYGRKELVQFVQGVTGQPGLLAKLERMITANAESKPIERFGKDLTNTLQNQFDRMIQTLSQLGAEFGKPVGELAKLLLRATRGVMEILIDLNEKMGGALSYLVTGVGGAMVINRLPFIGDMAKYLTGTAAQKFTNYGASKGWDQSGIFSQFLMHYGIEALAGGTVLGGYEYFTQKAKGARNAKAQQDAIDAHRFYENLVEEGYDEDVARKMAHAYHDGTFDKKYPKYDEDTYVQDDGKRNDSVGAMRASEPMDRYWYTDDVGMLSANESRWASAQEKRDNEGKMITKQADWPPFRIFDSWSREKKERFINEKVKAGRKGYDDIMYGRYANQYLDTYKWRENPGAYLQVLVGKGAKRQRSEARSDAEKAFMGAIAAGEIELNEQQRDWFHRFLMNNPDYTNRNVFSEDFWKEQADDYRTDDKWKKDFVNDREWLENYKGDGKRMEDLNDMRNKYKILAKNPLFQSGDKADDLILYNIEQQLVAIEGTIKHGTLKEFDDYRLASKHIKDNEKALKDFEEGRKYRNLKTRKEYLANSDAMVREWSTWDPNERTRREGEILERADHLRALGRNTELTSKQREDFDKMAFVMEQSVEKDVYTNPFLAQKEARDEELERQKERARRIDAEGEENRRLQAEEDKKRLRAEEEAAEKLRIAKEAELKEKQRLDEEAAYRAQLKKEEELLAEREKAKQAEIEKAKEEADAAKAAKEKAKVEKREAAAAARKAAAAGGGAGSPPPPIDGAAQGSFDFGGGDGGGGGGGRMPPKGVYDPATGQYYFDYGDGDAWRQMSQGQFEFPPYTPHERDSMFRQSRFGGDGFSPAYTQPFYQPDRWGRYPYEHIVDPATGQIMMDFGNNHRWGKMPQQMDLDLGPGGGLGSAAKQMVFDIAGVGAAYYGWEWVDGKARKALGKSKLYDDARASHPVYGEGGRAQDQAEQHVRDSIEKEKRKKAEADAFARQEALRETRERSKEDRKRWQEEQEKERRKRETGQTAWHEQRRADKEARDRRKFDEEWEKTGERLRKEREAHKWTKGWEREEREKQEAERRRVNPTFKEAIIDTLGFGVGGFFSDKFGESFDKFKKSTWMGSFRDGKVGMGIKDFFGQAKSKDMPKDISKMAYFMGKMYGLATTPVGIGVAAALGTWWGTNKIIDSTEWGRNQILLRDERDQSVFAPERIGDWQSMNLEWAEDLLDSRRIGKGKGNPQDYSSWADFWHDPIGFHMKNVREDMKDRRESFRVNKIMQKYQNETPEIQAELAGFLSSAGWSVIEQEEGRDGPRWIASRNKNRNRGYNFTGFKVEEEFAAEHGLLRAQDILGHEYLIKGDETLDKLDAITSPDLLSGRNEEKTDAWRRWRQLWPERGDIGHPINVSVINNNTINVSQGDPEEIKNVLDELNEESVLQITRRALRNAARPVE